MAAMMDRHFCCPHFGLADGATTRKLNLGIRGPAIAPEIIDAHANDAARGMDQLVTDSGQDRIALARCLINQIACEKHIVIAHSHVLRLLAAEKNPNPPR